MSEPIPPVSLRVLVVDDCADAADSLALILSLWGHRPVVAYDGAAAMAAAQQQRPDVALLDLALPVCDGFELARWLRRPDGAGKVLLIAVTAHAEGLFRRRADEAGFDFYMVKPIPLDVLERMLAARRAAPAPAPAPAGPHGAMDFRPVG